MAGSVLLSGGSEFTPEGRALVKAIFRPGAQGNSLGWWSCPSRRQITRARRPRNSTGAFNALGARADIAMIHGCGDGQ